MDWKGGTCSTTAGFSSEGFRVQGSGFRVQGSGFRVQGSGFRVQGSGFRVQRSGVGGWEGRHLLDNGGVQLRPACHHLDPAARVRLLITGFIEVISNLDNMIYYNY